VKLFSFLCPHGLTNCYILGASREGGGGEALVVDPGSVEAELVDCIESNGYVLCGALVTHGHGRQVSGLRSLKRIYDVGVFAVNGTVQGCAAAAVKDGDALSIGPFSVDVISVPGHTSDSAVFLVGNLLFTGDALTAGLVGPTDSAYGAAMQMGGLRGRILSLPGDYAVLPGRGPPSTLETERRFNWDMARYRDVHARKPGFRTAL